VLSWCCGAATGLRPTWVSGVIEEARANSAEITREPSPTFYGGYAGGFRDPDGHVWEVAYNPGFGLAGDGSVILPEH
jgi:uncharacterized protein